MSIQTDKAHKESAEKAKRKALDEACAEAAKNIVAGLREGKFR